MAKPNCILLMSGKRKCGKDYIAEILCKRLTPRAGIIRISAPLKGQYAKWHHLDLQELMSDGPYKELHRRAMIEWSDTVREKEPGYFCQLACSSADVKSIWIVSDVRRQTDVAWFKSEYGELIKTVRITADDAVRKERGWQFTTGVDDVTSECDLDNFTTWDVIIENNSNDRIETNIETILKLIN